MHLNANRNPNNYRYSESVLRFAGCLLILAGAYVYEFMRLNFKYLLPSIQTVSNIYKKERYMEAHFRFDETAHYLAKNDCQYVFVSEDCSGIIPRIEYDAVLDIFNGFVATLVDGKPIDNAFRCQSFEDFQSLFENYSRSSLINIHVVKPTLNANGYSSPATVLAAYGTDSKVSSIDLLKRWLNIYLELRTRNTHVLGFATDGDPKCLRAMRLASNFFVKNQTITIPNDNLSFKIQIPPAWNIWYFFDRVQLFLVMQDGVHLCNKMRNRLLSQKVHLRMGKFKVSIKHLYELIESTNKIDNNLSKSDLIVKDKQNFASCQRICDEKVLNLLLAKNEYHGTYNYLLLINLLITAYTQPEIHLSTRIFYAWIVVFFVRLWRLWLYKSRKISRFSNQNVNSHSRSYFITSNALFSIELNAHTLIFISQLIEQNLIPTSIANSVDLFSSQPCEAVFRDARSLSGIYSTRINFTVQQFLQRLNKLNALSEIKQFERNNNHARIVFPVHHKVKRLNKQNNSNDSGEYDCFDWKYTENIIAHAYEVAQQMAASVGMDDSLKKHKLFNIEQSSKMAQHLLELNILSESEILILDDQENETSDEEDGFIADEVNDIEDNDDDYDHQSDNSESEDIHTNDDDMDGDGDGGDDAAGFDYHDQSLEDDQPSTISFENVQSTTYSGFYYKKTSLERVLVSVDVEIVYHSLSSYAYSYICQRID